MSLNKKKNDSRTLIIRRSYHGTNQISKDIDELKVNLTSVRRDGSTDTEINSVTNFLNGLFFI